MTANQIQKKKPSEQQQQSKHTRLRDIENVLVLQGGGSLGAFACGAYKAFAKSKIHFDIVAGTSIGAINSAIIVGNKNHEDHPEKDLEDFWLELSESTPSIIPDSYIWDFNYEKQHSFLRPIPSAPVNAAFFGISKMFEPRWNWSNMISDSKFFMPATWTYLYDHNELLGKTLDKYIDYKKLEPTAVSENTQKDKKSSSRLIVTAVDVLTAKHLIFDSAKMQIQRRHLLASAAYPAYGFPWVEIEKDVYAWDGALMSNTPMRQVFKASPRNDKHVYVIENYPKIRKKLPSNRLEVEDRMRDIIFSDKTSYDIDIITKITRMIDLMDQMYDVVMEKSSSPSTDTNNMSEKIKNIKKEYHEIVENHGSEILSVHKISREVMEHPYPLKNADFSSKTIKDLITQGMQKASDHLNNNNNQKIN
ncbi:patatin-like phospholipase family protein [Nitrosopumilus sp.]|uniref:patatin-like phospholipase family protein n=1 Tax=Nitrosopumilus sp. TaxID=2024843 RepID=UPI0029305FED|nr:patatin-like phospholipase family protein [Nitrosopumilus sp.]